MLRHDCRRSIVMNSIEGGRFQDLSQNVDKLGVAGYGITQF